MRVSLMEKSNDELIDEYKELVELEQIIAWDQRQQADPWERRWLDDVRVKLGVVRMELEGRGIDPEED